MQVSAWALGNNVERHQPSGPGSHPNSMSLRLIPVALLGSLLAGMGITGAAQNAFNRIWSVPFKHRPNFLIARARGLGLLFVLGALNIVSTTVAGFVGTGSHGAPEVIGGVILALAFNLALFLFASDIGKLAVFPGADSYVAFSSEPVKWFTALILPWLVLAASFAAVYARLLRGSLLEVLGEDYIRTARAKGLSERRVVLRHGVRSAITPIVTVLGLDIGTLLGGALLIEVVFDIPGVGRLNYDAITHADFPIVQGTVLLAALFIVLANLLVDISYAFLDPRVRFK